MAIDLKPIVPLVKISYLEQQIKSFRSPPPENRISPQEIIQGQKSFVFIALQPMTKMSHVVKIVVFLTPRGLLVELGPVKVSILKHASKTVSDDKICDFRALGRDPKPI